MIGASLATSVVALALSVAAATPAPAAVQPELFSPQANWPAGTYVSPAFTPDGQTMFVTFGHVIMISHRQGDTWSTPEAAPFSGRWRDIETGMAPDGSYLVFDSNRPATEGGKPLAGFYNESAKPERGGNLWRVDRVGDGWGQPIRLPDVVNANSSVYAASVARDGDLVFMQPDPKTTHFRLYRSHFAGGRYGKPEPLPFSDGVTGDYDPVIAPDESFIIFSSDRSPATDSNGPVVFVAQADGRGGWRTPVALDPTMLGTETRLSPDLSTLYYTTDRPTPAAPPPPPGSTAQKIWTIPLSSVSPALKATG